jgi:PAS domain S-box-containing protein
VRCPGGQQSTAGVCEHSVKSTCTGMFCAAYHNMEQRRRFVRILLLDDRPEEMERGLASALDWTIFDRTLRVAQTQEAFVSALTWQPDVILCAAVLQRFDAAKALEVLTLQRAEVPVVLLTTAGEYEPVPADLNSAVIAIIVRGDQQQLRIATKAALRVRGLQDETRNLGLRLQESEARFRDVAQLSSDWYWEQDTEFRFTLFSRDVADSGYEGSALLGQTRWSHQGVDLSSADFRAHQTICEAHQPFRDFTYRRFGSDGSEHWISASGQPVFDDAGLFKGYRGVGRDVTAHRAKAC